MSNPYFNPGAVQTAPQVITARFDEKEPVMILRIPLLVDEKGAPAPRPSSSGSSAILATTGGIITIGGIGFRGFPLKLNLSIMAPVGVLPVEGQAEAAARKATPKAKGAVLPAGTQLE